MTITPVVPGKFGIVAYFDAVGGTAYCDVRGAAQASKQVTTAYQIAQASPSVGRCPRLLIRALAAFAGGGVSQWTFFARLRPDPDLNNSGITQNPAEIMIARLDGGTPPTYVGELVEQGIVPTDVTGLDGVAGGTALAYVTTSALLGGTVELLVKAVGTPATGDSLILYLDGGPL